MWVGLAAAAVVAGFLLWAWLRPAPRAPEPEPDPDSPYTPAGSQILRALRDPESPDDRLRRDWR